MKITKKAEKEILEVYNAYWDNYLKGNVKSMALLLDEEYTQIGSAEGEVFFDKKGAVQFLRDTIDQVAGKVEMRNRSIKLEPHQFYVLITELTDLFVLTDSGWVFHSKFRASSLMEKKAGVWKIAHQHSSFPDIRAEEGENIAIGKIEAENIQLRDAIKRRTVELEQRNRDLEIEAALERVRARTMAMHHSEELSETAFMLFQQFRELGEVPDQITIGIFNEKEKVIEFWLTIDGKQVNRTAVASIDEPTLMHKQYVAWKKKRKSLVVDLAGRELKNYLKYRVQLSRSSKVPVFKGKNPKRRIVHSAFFSKGLITFSSTLPRPKESLRMLERFAAVFEQTYTRFLDLQKAEAQAREGQIELALERVRARTMAMRSSSELTDAATVLFKELKSLGVETIRTGIGIIDGPGKTVEIWSTQWTAEQENKILGVVPVNIHPFFKGYFRSWQKKESFFSYELRGADVPRYYKSMSSTLSYPLRKKYNPREIFYTFFFADGSLNVIATEDLGEEVCSIMVRFAKVFELIYRRFRDLQKAEAQAREAQIEAALERIRSRSMAMRKTNELLDAAELVYRELTALGIASMNVSYCFVDVEEKNASYYSLNPVDGKVPPFPFVFPHTETRVMRSILSSWKKQEPFNLIELDQAATLKHQTWAGEHILETIKKRNLSIPFSIKSFLAISPKKAVIYSFNFKSGYVFNIGGARLTKAQEELVLRFTKVFEQTYTRFLDLQKAEAQAREAQIELALERVRAKAMAMHNSRDLADTISIFYRELRILSETPRRIGVALIDKETRMAELSTMSTTEQGGSVEGAGSLKMAGHWLLEDVYRYWLKQKEYHAVLGGNQIKEYYQWLKPQISYPDYPHDVAQYGYYFMFPEGDVVAWTEKELQEDELKIYRRFTSVVSLTYKRYKDLQRAEAQAREAQIESSLERVRSKTMAMHQSAQLPETAQVLFEQFAGLGKIPDRIGIGIIKEELQVIEWWVTDQTGSQLTRHFNASILQPTHAKWVAAWKEGKDSLVIDLSGKELKEWVAFVRYEVKMPIDDSQMKGRRVHHVAFFSQGLLLISAHEPMASETIQLLVRFAKVFSQTYTRFLDLQKAEAQTREAQIEAALERVRSRTMGMQKSEELKEVIQVVYEQFVHLNIHIEHCGFILDYKARDDMHIWLADRHEVPAEVTIPYFDSPHWNSFIEAKEKGIDFFANYLSFEVKNKFYRELFEYIHDVPEESREYYLGCPGLAISTVLLENVGLYIENFLGAPYTDEENSTLMRFGNVFQQTFTRFLDLQNAEIQAREATIEASLERVRASAMAMHSSEDVVNATGVLFKELHKLGIETMRCGILIIDDDRTMEVWSVTNTDDGKTVRGSGRFNMDDHPLWVGLFNNWKQKEEFYYYHLAGEDKKDYYRVITTTAPKYFSAPLQELPDQDFQGYNFQEGTIWTFSLHPHSEEDKQVLKRFTAVFSLTFRRYQDLKKAEAQSREAKIEASLERVRASAMAMHTSEEVVAATSVLFVELHRLGIETVRCGILIISKSRTMEVWTAAADEEGHPMKIIGVLDMTIHPLLIGLYTSWEQNAEFYEYRLTGNDKRVYYETLAALPTYSAFSKYINAPDHTLNFFMFAEGGVYTFSENQFSEETKAVLKKFTAVFSLTFRRYKDLKKAEAQAREALLEASLERVRGKAMAMHSSADLAATIGVFYHELESMSLTPRRVGVGLINRETRVTDVLTINSTQEGDSVEILGQVKLMGHPAFEGMYDNWLEQKELHVVLHDQEIKKYNDFLRSQILLPELPVQPEQHGYWFAFPEGSVYTWAENELTEDELRIYRRFTTVLSLTYKRYKDLKESEARALLAIREASLDRVRAGIASMRTAEDLNHITPLIWRELKALGLPFFRCGLIIANENDQIADFYLSTPENKPLAALHLRFDSEGTIKNAMAHWRQQKVYTDHWDREQFAAFAKSMLEQGQIQTANTYQGGEEPPESLTLQFMPFVQGMLYVGSAEPLSESHIELAKALAEAFSTAYARYEDFTKLEAAKLQIEKTLVDLKQTQAQLVQSEKMASLGELTAGIAHEIQNPLNFVNNFSEVNKELLEEMKMEIEKGNFDEVNILAKDIIDNEEKINHHGKRADGIVKGMLQHSRSSSGQKEPTDINALADEYLRLAYHGLRAKDKSFNAKFDTKFDEGIGKVPVIPQDMGRVVLNLITNAFYAVTERKKLGAASYEPTVTVSTRRSGNQVLISVKDNGNGIPKKVLDKIFQPFFTTKPTGQGTGLGLSMSYDIVKAHGGELKVETKDGEGAIFTVSMPV